MAPNARTNTLQLAISWLTVLPAPTPATTPDRADGGRVIAAVPAVGILLGVIAAAVAFGLSHTALPSLIIGALVVALLALLTRGMHLDGLADTADGLGCYGDPERVRTVMRSGDVGPFGVATLVLTLLLQAFGFATLIGDHRWYTIALVIFVSRVMVVLACRTSISPANNDGFGALVAGTQRVSIGVWLVAAAVAGLGAGWLSAEPFTAFRTSTAITAVAAVAATAVISYVFTRHCARRMGGSNGDTLGATIELATTAMVVLLLV